MFEGNNYLLKMRKDNAFLGLKSNQFLKYFNFTDWGDPFLIIPSIEYNGVGSLWKKRKKKKRQADDKITIPIENSILKKIKRCEVVLDTEWKNRPDREYNTASQIDLQTSPGMESGEMSPDPVMSNPTAKKSSSKLAWKSIHNKSIAEIAAGPTEESTFVPKMDPNKQPSKKVADVDDVHYRIEPLALKEKWALDFLNYYN